LIVRFTVSGQVPCSGAERRSKVLDEVSTAILGGAAAVNAAFQRARLFALRCKSLVMHLWLFRWWLITWVITLTGSGLVAPGNLTSIRFWRTWFLRLIPFLNSGRSIPIINSFFVRHAASYDLLNSSIDTISLDSIMMPFVDSRGLSKPPSSFKTHAFSKNNCSSAGALEENEFES